MINHSSDIINSILNIVEKENIKQIQLNKARDGRFSSPYSISSFINDSLKHNEVYENFSKVKLMEMEIGNSDAFYSECNKHSYNIAKGILGEVISVLVIEESFKELGYKVYFSEIHEDAINKIDFYLTRDDSHTVSYFQSKYFKNSSKKEILEFKDLNEQLQRKIKEEKDMNTSVDFNHVIVSEIEHDKFNYTRDVYILDDNLNMYKIHSFHGLNASNIEPINAQSVLDYLVDDVENKEISITMNGKDYSVNEFESIMKPFYSDFKIKF